MSENNNGSQKKISYTAIGMAVGLVFGGIVGLLTNSEVISGGGGMVIGLAIGYALDRRRA